MEAKKESPERKSVAKGRELTNSRLVNAPRELVWQVFTQPEHIKHWWGPNGFTNTIYKMEAKPGGIWDFMMHGPDGRDYKNEVMFKEMVKYEKIVLQHVNGPKHITTISFSEQGDKTLINWHMLFESDEQLQAVITQFRADDGLTQNLDKLVQYLSTPMQYPPFTLNRVFNAPIEMVYKAWTDPKQLAAWWGPKDFTNPVVDVDVRPSGKMYIEMTFPDGTPHPMRGEFVEVDPPHRLVFKGHAFYDKQGNPGLEVVNSVMFTDLGGKTRINLHAQVISIKPEFAAAVTGMDEGWSQSLDRLGFVLDGAATNDEAAKSKPLVLERTIKAPISMVWEALTDTTKMKQWYMDMTNFKPEVGCEFSFSAGKDNIKYMHLCKVTEVISGKKLAYTWRYEGYEGDSLVTFELHEDGGKTILRVTHAGLETFKDMDASRFARANFYGGWTLLIGTSLREFLTKA